MNTQIPDSFCLIAGKGAYPILLAKEARAMGVKRIAIIACRGETDSSIEKYADDTRWIHLGQLGHMLDAMKKSGMKHAIMAGQITPTHLFHVRMDSKMLNLLMRLKTRNAGTIFGAIGDELKTLGIELLPASMFMESYMPAKGLLSKRGPTAEEQNDINLGMRVAAVTSELDIGQTVVVKNGAILAIEAFEGTNETIKRAGELGGAGIVIVKVAKRGHDMRFDIPVIGMHTMKLLRKPRAAVLAVEAGRSIILERNEVIAEADKMDLCLMAIAFENRP